MKISELIEGLDNVSIIEGDPQSEIRGICCDSRSVAEGELFIAVKGTAADGRAFVPDAMKKGAAGAVEADRHSLALLADRFFDHPSRKLALIGITGTNGKTTTVTLLYNMFRSLGLPCGMLSTIANYVEDTRLETTNTTADPITINSLLSRMVEQGCKYCFMEVSSIGVHQQRVAGLHFAVGIFSNLTHDHLDYHGTFAEYLRCKKAFFDNLGKDAVAITNIDDKNGRVMVQNTAARIVTYACRTLADHTARILEQSTEGSLLSIDGTQVWSLLIGEHNAYNLLAIYSTAVELGIDKDTALVALSSLHEAPGRLETVRSDKSDKTVVIDYAHTPDALENVLKTLRGVSPGKELVCLFGCGGDRDRTKRPEMAKIAGQYADRIIVTADNSRSEDTGEIIKEICTGFSDEARSRVICIPDRAEAIRAAILFAPAGAVILLAGKGHENYQIIGKEKKYFCEREIAESILNQ